jgi:hypothetical protein
MIGPALAKLFSAGFLRARMCPPEIRVEPQFRQWESLASLHQKYGTLSRLYLCRTVRAASQEDSLAKCSCVKMPTCKKCRIWSLSVNRVSCVECTVMLQLKDLPVTQIHLR